MLVQARTPQRIAAGIVPPGHFRYYRWRLVIMGCVDWIE
jgi:hypothetical protein